MHYLKTHILQHFNNIFSNTRRTLVECGGLCLSHSTCGAFHWDQTTCTVLNKELLYADKTTQVDTYIQQPNGPGNRMPGMGIT